MAEAALEQAAHEQGAVERMTGLRVVEVNVVVNDVHLPQDDPAPEPVESRVL